MSARAKTNYDVSRALNWTSVWKIHPRLICSSLGMDIISCRLFSRATALEGMAGMKLCRNVYAV